MTNADEMRGYLKLFEAPMEYTGKMNSASVSYSAEGTKGQITKVTAYLTSYDSGRYTKLGRNLKRIEALTEEIKELQAATKQEARELVADLFHAEDAICTRVVDTVSFVFNMSKDPKATESVSYSKVLAELEGHLSPDLMKTLIDIKKKHTSAPVQKAASLSATDKAVPAEESINEGIGDKLKGFFSKLKNWADSWGQRYDGKLDQLKAELGMNEAVAEDQGSDTGDAAEDFVNNVVTDAAGVLDSAQHDPATFEEHRKDFWASMAADAAEQGIGKEELVQAFHRVCADQEISDMDGETLSGDPAQYL